MKNKFNNSKARGLKAVLPAICLVLFSLFAQAQSVSKAEYFFDFDPGFGLGTQVSLIQSTDSTWQLPTISTSGLPKGYHRLYIRTKATSGKWSETTRMVVEIIANNTQFMDSITSAEYFLDTDPKNGHGTAITINPHDSSITKTFTIPASFFTSKSIGYHTLYGRVRDNLGRWSETFRTRIDLLKTENATQVVKVEYFFVRQKDLGYGLNHSKTFSQVFVDSTVTFNIDTSQLQFHPNDTLFLRVRNNYNSMWSQTAMITGLNITVVGPRLAENSIETGSFKLYPNPAADHITINFDKDVSEPMEVTLTNLIGEVVKEQMINDRETRINFNQPPGIYFVNLKSSKETLTRKIIIQ